MLFAGGAAFSQTEAELCQQAQSAQRDNNFSEAMRAAGRALAKNPDASCRRTRIEAALKMEPSSAHYMTAISDLDYLMGKGDNSENNLRMMGDAEAGLAKLHFDNKNFTESGKHYQRAKDAYGRAKGMGNGSNYDTKIANVDNQLKQAMAQKK